MKAEIDAGVLFCKIAKGHYSWLVLKRKEGWLDFPKGHVESGESMQSAALREAFEETHLHATLDPFFLYSYSYKVNGRDKTVSMFLAKSYNGKIKVSHEHEGCLWLSENMLGKLKYESMRLAILAASSYMHKSEEIKSINRSYAKLAEATSWNLSKRFVPGYGNVSASIMLIGQAPGAMEDKELKPFVGRSGKLLDELLSISGISRSSVYITSAVQFFPPKNRPPTQQEIEACKPFLLRQIDVINPKLIILLGRVAAKALGFAKHHEGECISNSRIYFLAMHPAAAIRIKSNLPKIKMEFKLLGKCLNKAKA
ncbi:MAG: uracil-DNA glycosylase family protein [Candidatus Micrarchaeaceae archaeon]